jgi:cell division protein FtsB
MNDEPPINKPLPMRYVLDLAFEHVKILQRQVDRRDEIIREGSRQNAALEIKNVGLKEQVEKLREKNERLKERNTALLAENDKLLQGVIKELRRDEEIIKLKNKINELKQ